MAERPAAKKPRATRRQRKRPASPPPEVAPLSLPTLRILLRMLNMQTLDVSAEDFESVALDVMRAKSELKLQIEAAEAVESAAAAASPDGEAAGE